MLKDFLKPENVTAVDARTVRMTLYRAFAPFLSYVPWWYVVNPRQVMANQAEGDLGRRWLTENAAGSGPFRLRRFDANALIHLDTVPDHWKGWPMGEEKRLAGVIYRIIREAAPRRAALQRREADAIQANSDDLSQLARIPGVRAEDHPGFTTFGIKFNCQQGPTADVNLRKAIAYAFDYDALIAIHNGAADDERPAPGHDGPHRRAGHAAQGPRQGARLPAPQPLPGGRDRAGIRARAGARGPAAHRPRPARQPARAEHPREHRRPALDDDGAARIEAGDGGEHDLGVRDAGRHRP